MSDPLAFQVLGPLAVRRHGSPVKLGSPKERLILGVLLMHAGRVVSTERLIDVLWGESPPDRALSTLQVHVSRLRQKLTPGEPNILTQPPGYFIDPPTEDLDLLRFEALVADGRARANAGDLDQAIVLLGQAEALSRGTCLADLEAVPFVEATRVSLEELRVGVLEEQVNLFLAADRNTEALPLLATALDLHPLRESLWEQRMLALYRSGRQAEALSAYRTCRGLLLDELGVEPSPRLRDLEHAILNQSPSLDHVAEAAIAQARAAARQPDVSATLMTVKFDATLARDSGPAVPLSGVTTLGRHPDCDVVLTDPAVSRVHAEIRPALGGHLLSDLNSSNGTFVGDQQVLRHLLVDGDEIFIGDVSLRYEQVQRTGEP